MKITNFRGWKVINSNTSNELYTAKIDVTTGFLWWKRTTTREIQRKLATFWFFIETGEYVPGNKIDALERAFLATNR
jgi:hypothetical protein